MILRFYLYLVFLKNWHPYIIIFNATTVQNCSFFDWWLKLRLITGVLFFYQTKLRSVRFRSGFRSFTLKKKEATKTHFQQHSLLQTKHTTLATQSLRTLAPLLNTRTLASQKKIATLRLCEQFFHAKTQSRKRSITISESIFDPEFPIIILYEKLQS